MAKNLAKDAGKDAIRELGWWRAHRFLILRRLCQLTIGWSVYDGTYMGYFTG